MKLHIVFDGPPGPEAGRLVEVETESGISVRVGTWEERDTGLWALVIDTDAVEDEVIDSLSKAVLHRSAQLREATRLRADGRS